MSQTYNTIGLVLKRKDYQETDRLFCLYTKDFGKMDILAKGTKKISSKLNAYLEPLYLIKVMIAKGKVFDKLANCDLIKSYQNLRQDIFGFYLLNYLAEATDGLIVGQTLQNDKFELLVQTLDILDLELVKKSASQGQLLFLANLYFLKLLNLLGYQPEIKRCLICHKGILLTKNIFDFSQGGIICEQCKKVCLIEDYILVSDGVIKLLQLAEESELAKLVNLAASPADLEQFNQVVNRLLLVNLERPLISYEFVSKALD
jgi:DNA repair protein RecO (recombination protein O)